MESYTSLLQGFIYPKLAKYVDGKYILPLIISKLDSDSLSSNTPFRAIVQVVFPESSTDTDFEISGKDGQVYLSINNNVISSCPAIILPYEQLYEVKSDSTGVRVSYSNRALFLINYTCNSMYMIPITNLSDVVRTADLITFPSDIKVNGAKLTYKEIISAIETISGGDAPIHLDDDGNLIIPGDFKAQDGTISLVELSELVSQLENSLTNMSSDITDIKSDNSTILSTLSEIISEMNNFIQADENGNVSVSNLIFNDSEGTQISLLDFYNSFLAHISSYQSLSKSVEDNSSAISEMSNTLSDIKIALDEDTTDIENIKSSLEELATQLTSIQQSLEDGDFLCLNEDNNLVLPKDLIFDASGLSDFDFSEYDVSSDEFSSSSQSLVTLLKALLTVLSKVNNAFKEYVDNHIIAHESIDASIDTISKDIANLSDKVNKIDVSLDLSDVVRVDSEGNINSDADVTANMGSISLISLYTTINAIQNQTYEGTNLSVKFASEIKSFDDVWAWIKSRINDGNYSGIFVGDYISDALVSGSTIIPITMRILGIDCYSRISAVWSNNSLAQEVTHHIDFMSDERPANYQYSSTGLTSNDFSKAKIYNLLNNTILSELSSSLQSLISEKELVYLSYDSESGFVRTGRSVGKLWLPAWNEISCEYPPYSTTVESIQCVQYPLYNQFRMKFLLNRQTPLIDIDASSGTFESIDEFGSHGKSSAETRVNVPIAFRISADSST